MAPPLAVDAPGYDPAPARTSETSTMSGSFLALASRRQSARHSWLSALIATAVVFIVVVGLWDQNREAEAMLGDFERAQAAHATLLAAGVATQLEGVRSDARLAAAGFTDELREQGLPPRYESLSLVTGDAPRRPAPTGTVMVSVPVDDGRRVDVVVRTAQLLAGANAHEVVNLALIRPPGDQAFHAASGAQFQSGPLRAGLDEGRTAMRLPGEQASALGMPDRNAVVGIASTDAGSLGRWGVAVVSSAGSLRDRHARAQLRLIVGVLVAGGLVLGFGGYALRAQRKELELARELTLAELQQQRDEQLERESRAATMLTLAAGVAHEISTPLSVIHGRAEQLLERTREERDTRAARRILEQSARIESVIRGFLKLARGDAPALERLDPGEVVRESVGLVGHRFTKAGVRLGVRSSVRVPAERADRRLLEHAMVNLLLNACDACERGGTVTLATRLDVETSRAVFEVEDDGAGISPDLAAHVTQPFFSTKPPGEGTGLGLAIASEIVKIHRGSLVLSAREPHGTRATVCIPIAEGTADATA